jgi:hypothetical protein
MTHRFDELARTLAQTVSRRGAIRGVVGSMIGTVAMSAGLRQALAAPGTSKACKEFCKDVPKAQRSQCLSACATCGDPNGLCGAPGAFACCPPDTTCCPGGCGGVCTDTDVDPSNCGACGHVCDAAQDCSAGICVQRCLPGQVLCTSGTGQQTCCAAGSTCCVGATGTVTCCAEGTTCVTGACVPVPCPAGTIRCGSVCCTTPACCAGGTTCQTTHQNGRGQLFYDCNPLGTYTLETAMEACQAHATQAGACTTVTCGGGGAAVCDDCACWAYSGPAAGHVTPPGVCGVCPSSGDPIWT